MAAVTTIVLVAAAAVTAIAAAQQGAAAQEEANFSAAVDRQRAESEKKVAAASERDFRKRQSGFSAQQRAALGGAGVRTGTGSALVVAADFDAETELQARRIRAGGDIRATRLQQQAQLTQFAGRGARRRGDVRAGASLLSGLGQAFV